MSDKAKPVACVHCRCNYNEASETKHREKYRYFINGWCAGCLAGRGKCAACKKPGYITDQEKHLCEACYEERNRRHTCSGCRKNPVTAQDRHCQACRREGCEQSHELCLLARKCCHCHDERPLQGTYEVYVDGVGFVKTGSRSQYYCETCSSHFKI